MQDINKQEYLDLDDKTCSDCHHDDRHYPPLPTDDMHGPLEGETWVCEHSDCHCLGFVPEEPLT